jgi:hypothetical protein
VTLREEQSRVVLRVMYLRRNGLSGSGAFGYGAKILRKPGDASEASGGLRRTVAFGDFAASDINHLKSRFREGGLATDARRGLRRS